MENRIPNSIPELLTRTENAADGAVQFGPATGLSQNTEQKIRADIAALLAARTSLDQGRINRDLFYDELKMVTSQANTFATLARDILKPKLGRQYSPKWDITGFGSSLQVATKPEELQPLVQSLQMFFGNQPTAENESLSVTALKAGEFFERLSTLRSKINAQETEIQNLTAARDAAVRQLRRRFRGLIDELNQLLDPLDPRWLAFGFNMPGAQERPDVPENVSVTLVNNTNAALTWTTPARAEYFHVWRKIVGIDQEPVLVGSPTDLDFTMEELPTNSTIEVAVSAVNNGGESPLSETVIVKTS